jgi:hypothetical protein
VLFSKDRDGDENFNLWCVGIGGSDPHNLTPYSAVLATVLGMHHEDPNLIAVGMDDRDARWHDLYLVDIRTGECRLVYENKDEIASFISDSRLNLGLATTARDKGRGSAIMKWTGAAFEEIMSIEADDVLSTEPLHVNRAGDAWFLRSSVGRDKAAMLRVVWMTGAKSLVARHDKADVTSCMTDPRTEEVTAVSAEYIRSEWIAIDPATERDLAMLARELDGTIAIESQSDDDTLWVVAASCPDRPLAWHLLDRRLGKITSLFSSRPKLEKVKLAPMRGVVIRSRDGLDLIAYLTLPKPTSSLSSSIAPTALAPSLPRTGNHEKGIGDGAAGDLTIESCGQLPLHRPGRSSSSSSSAPPSLARARATNMSNADTVSAAEFAIGVDDPVARCARPAPNPRLRAAIIADRSSDPNRRSRRHHHRSPRPPEPSLSRAREGRDHGQRGAPPSLSHCKY